MTGEGAQTPRASAKIEEAEFFLSRARESTHDIKTFGFFISACLAATESIFYVLRDNEYPNVFIDVEKAWRASLPESDRAFLNRMVGRRGAEVHGEGMLLATAGESVKLDLIVQRPDGTIASVLGPGMVAYGLTPRHSFGDANPEEVIVACERFLRLRRDLAAKFSTV